MECQGVRFGAVTLDGGRGFAGAMERHDADIYPGTRAGPLSEFEKDRWWGSTNQLRLSGAIPGKLAQSVERQLMEKGLVSRSWLGVEISRC